jgi:hypothetical protein
MNNEMNPGSEPADEPKPGKSPKRNRNLRSETRLDIDSSELMRKYEPSLQQTTKPDSGPTNESALSAEPFSSEAETVRQIHDTLRNVGRTMLEQMVRAGEILTRVKEGLPHGQWMPWAAKNLPNIHHRTLNRYMLVYRRREDPLMQSDPARLLDEVHGHSDSGEDEPNSTPASNLPENPAIQASGEEQPNLTSASSLPPEEANSPAPTKRTRKPRRQPIEKSRSASFDSSATEPGKANELRVNPLSERIDFAAGQMEYIADELSSFGAELAAVPLSESVRAGMVKGLGNKAELLRRIARELHDYAKLCEEGERRL